MYPNFLQAGPILSQKYTFPPGNFRAAGSPSSFPFPSGRLPFPEGFVPGGTPPGSFGMHHLGSYGYPVPDLSGVMYYPPPVTFTPLPGTFTPTLIFTLQMVVFGTRSRARFTIPLTGIWRDKTATSCSAKEPTSRFLPKLKNLYLIL